MRNLNDIISALIATNFFGSNTEQHDEKVKKAGLARILLYFLLIIAIIPIFVKSYRVGTFQNLVKISPLKLPINDTILEPVDSIDIAFINCLSNDTTRYNAVKNIFNLYISKISKAKSRHKESTHYNDNSSSGIMTVYHNAKPKNERAYYFNPYDECVFLEDLLTKRNNGQIHNTPFLYPPFFVDDSIVITPIIAAATIKDYNEHKNDTTKCKQAAEQINGLFELTTQEVEKLYVTEYYGSMIPSFLPFVFDKMIGGIAQNDSVYCSFKWEPVDTDTLALVGYHYKEYYGTKGNTIPFSNVNLKGKLGQLGFLTAADISQAFYNIDVITIYPVRSIEFLFDVPIELSDDIYPAPDMRNLRGFGYTDPSKIEEIKETGGVEFHVKFPSLESQQLIRSLILSTIFTSIVALFAKNLYYYVRSINWNFTHRIKRKNRKRKYKWYVMYSLIYSILLFLDCYYCYRIMTENPLYISSENLTKVSIVSIAAILLFSLVWRFVHLKCNSKDIDENSQN